MMTIMTFMGINVDGKRKAAAVQTGIDSGAGSRTAADEAFARIYADVLSGALPPGTKLKPDELKDRYGIGLSPIREALLRLSADGLVLQHPQRGFRTPSVSLEEFIDLTRVRTELSCLALRWAMERGGHEWEEEVVSTFYRLDHSLGRFTQGAVNQPDFELERRNWEFHSALEACGSPWLLHMSAIVYRQMERYRRMYLSYHSSMADGQQEHKAIMDAVFSRDVELATCLLKAHVESRAALVRDTMIARHKLSPVTTLKTRPGTKLTLLPGVPRAE
jgi:GntR family carbon starvation induced transcriptional regulator